MKSRTAFTLASIAVLALAAANTGCGTSTFYTQVVSCADKKPVPDAKLTYSTPETNGADKLVSEMPTVTSQDGTVEAEVTGGKGTSYAMTIQKDGYKTKTTQLTSGQRSTVCLDPDK